MTHQADLSPYFESLSFHFAKSKHGQNEAFMYTVKAAAQCIDRESYSEGLEFSIMAYNMMTRARDARCLKHVVGRAIKNMQQPRSLFRRLFSSGKPTVVCSPQELKQYEKLKEDLVCSISELETLTDEVGPDIKDTHSTNSLYIEHLATIGDAAKILHSASEGTVNNSGSQQDEYHLSFTPPPPTNRASSISSNSDRVKKNTYSVHVGGVREKNSPDKTQSNCIIS